MTSWKIYKLSEIANISTGFPFAGEKYAKEGIRVVRGDNVTIGALRWDYDKLKCWNEPFARADEFSLMSGDIVVGMDGSRVGLNRAQVKETDLPLLLAQRVACIRHNEKTTQDFLYYQIFSERFVKYIKQVQTGTSIPHVSLKQIGGFEVSLPSLEQQQRIAGILGAIDDKIENNRRINDNLEQQAQALYKQWFVDNRNNDWEEKPLSEIVFFQEGPGIRNWQYVEKKGVRFINIRCINDGDVNVQNANMISEDEACGKYAHFLLEPLDIVMSCSGTLGRYAIIRQEHLPLCLNTSVIRFRPAQCIEDYSFVYGYLSSAEFLNKQEEMACGSVQANFGPTHLKQIKIKVPPKDYRMKYNNVVMPIINTMLKNRSEINMLSSLRDTLLPKLMNGEIKL